VTEARVPVLPLPVIDARTILTELGGRPNRLVRIPTVLTRAHLIRDVIAAFTATGVEFGTFFVSESGVGFGGTSRFACDALPPACFLIEVRVLRCELMAVNTVCFWLCAAMTRVYITVRRVLQMGRFDTSTVFACVVDVSFGFSVCPNVSDTMCPSVPFKKKSGVAFAVLESVMDETAVL
jgi:hypothetical protein